MNRALSNLPMLMLAFYVVPLNAAAQSADELPPELLACAAHTDVAERLACFDREMAKLQAAPEPVVAPEPAESAPAVAEAPPEAAPAEAMSEPAPEVAAAEPSTEPVPDAVAADSAPEATIERAPPSATAAPAAAAAGVAAASAAPVPDSGASNVPEPASTPTAPAATTGENVAEDFGLPDDGPDEFTASVSNIMTRPYGEMVILLDNGQIWEQKHRDNRFRLEVGEDVTISKGLISGFRLAGGNRNNSIQVERLK